MLLDGTNGEKNASPNKDSARGYGLIDKIKSNLEQACPSTVSCADILTVAAAAAVYYVRTSLYICVLMNFSRYSPMHLSSEFRVKIAQIKCPNFLSTCGCASYCLFLTRALYLTRK